MARLRSRSGKPPGGCLSLFGLPFLLAGLAISWMYFSGFSSWWRARSWEEVPCWIESAELKVSHGDDSTTYNALATYRYEFAGRTFRGEKVAFGAGSDNVGDFHQAAHLELSGYVVKEASHAEAFGQEGDRKPFRCYVNPSHPDEAVLYRGIRWEMQGFLAIFALTFPAVGAGLVAGGVLTNLNSKKEDALCLKYPEEPWKWKSKWAGPLIPESSGASGKAVVIYTIWSGLIVAPLIAATAMAGAFQKEPTAWLLLIFVLLWCLPAWFSLKRLRQRLAIGLPRLELMEMPASPGRQMEGAILLDKPLPVHGTPELALICEKLITRATGDGTTTSTEKIWTHQEIVPQDRVVRDISGYRLPVSFILPADAPVSGAGGDPSVTHVWKLKLAILNTAMAPEFEVPVFQTGKAPVVTAARESVH